MKHVSIAVLTYCRTAHITELLPVLLGQSTSVDHALYRVRIVVVDNDPRAGARAVVEQGGARGPIRYVNEIAPGIAAARNRALRECRTEDILVFIDDDERPTPGWLTALLDAYERHGGAAVAGPVQPVFVQQPPRWIEGGGFFDPPEHRSGDVLASAATNNLLLDLHQVRSRELTFDQRFGTSGGEDSHFTRRLSQAGGLIHWSQEAVVTELVPPERATSRWVFTRALRNGNSWSRVRLDVAGSASVRTRLRFEFSARAVARVARRAPRLCTAGVGRDAVGAARAVGEMVGGAGMLLGAWGFRVEEYRRRPGRGQQRPSS